MCTWRSTWKKGEKLKSGWKHVKINTTDIVRWKLLNDINKNVVHHANKNDCGEHAKIPLIWAPYGICSSISFRLTRNNIVAISNVCESWDVCMSHSSCVIIIHWHHLQIDKVSFTINHWRVATFGRSYDSWSD